MARFWVILAVVAVAFIVYSLVDCAMADRARIRGPRKLVWILLILVLPIIGGLLWFVIGRGRAPSSRRPATRIIAPDDDPNFIAGLRRNKDEDERIRLLEEQFGRSDDGSDPRRGPDGGSGSQDPESEKDSDDSGTGGSGPTGRRDG